MKTVAAYDVDNAIIRQLGTEFVAQRAINWCISTRDMQQIHNDFEYELDADLAIDYVGIKTYFKNNVPIAWVDSELGRGYKEIKC